MICFWVILNVVSTALMTIFLSKIVGMKTGEITLSICDAHIYSNHIEQVKRQLSRKPFKFPTLEINKDIGSFDDILDLDLNNLIIKDYKYYPGIKAPMAV